MLVIGIPAGLIALIALSQLVVALRRPRERDELVSPAAAEQPRFVIPTQRSAPAHRADAETVPDETVPVSELV
jgi:hypothetical protein